MPLPLQYPLGLLASGTLENAQAMAAHKSPRTTKLYDRTATKSFWTGLSGFRFEASRVARTGSAICGDNNSSVGAPAVGSALRLEDLSCDPALIGYAKLSLWTGVLSHLAAH